MSTTTLPQNQVIQVRVDTETKKQVDRILGKLGLSMSQAIKLYLNKLILKKGIPFDVTVTDTYEKSEDGYPDFTPEEWNRIAAYSFSIGEEEDEPLNIAHPDKLKPIDFSHYA